MNSLIARKLLNQGILVVKLKSSLRKFYSSHGDLVNRYGISVSQMATAMLLFCNQNIVPSKSMTCHRHFYKTNRTGACTSRVGIAYLSGSHDFPLVFLWIRIVQCLATVVLLVIFCLLIFCSTLRGRLLS